MISVLWPNGVLIFGKGDEITVSDLIFGGGIIPKGLLKIFDFTFSKGFMLECLFGLGLLLPKARVLTLGFFGKSIDLF